jgi:carboxyl-terminal processing protease
MNENTASAAELFCAALKDYKKATLIGVTTFGKGTVQSINRLSDNSALKISSARYSPPFSDNYDGVGVTPHIEVTLDEDLRKVSVERLTLAEDSQLHEGIQEILRLLE